jgi:hypothetical protein
VRLGKIPVLWITVFCRACIFIRSRKFPGGTDINYYRSNECFVESKFNDSAHSLTFEKKYRPTLIIKRDLGEVGWGDVDWIGPAQDRNRWRDLVNSILNLRVP